MFFGSQTVMLWTHSLHETSVASVCCMQVLAMTVNSAPCECEQTDYISEPKKLAS